MTKPILVIGGTGKTGARVVGQLEALGRSVRIGSRNALPAFDWHDEDGWRAALDGVSAAYVSYFPDIALPGAVERVEKFVRIAVEQDVRRLVLLSGRGEEEARRAEKVLMNSGADWTIIRASWFAQNFSEGFFADSIRAGTVHFPRDGVPEPFIDVDDIAEVATRALIDDRHIGKLYEVTGPRMLTFREAFAEIATAAGRPVTYVAVEIEDYVAALKQDGVPDDFVQLLELLTSEVLDGRNAYVTDGVRRALGREARDFSDYAAAAAAAGAWGQP